MRQMTSKNVIVTILFGMDVPVTVRVVYEQQTFIWLEMAKILNKRESYDDKRQSIHILDVGSWKHYDVDL